MSYLTAGHAGLASLHNNNLKLHFSHRRPRLSSAAACRSSSPASCSGDSRPKEKRVKYSFFNRSTAVYRESSSQYEECLTDRVLLAIMTRIIASTAGLPMPHRIDFASFVELSKQWTRGQGPSEQQQAVKGMLKRAVPPFVPPFLRVLARVFPNRVVYETNTWLAHSMFQWLVGPTEINAVEVNGTAENTVMKITKCRYLEVRLDMSLKRGVVRHGERAFRLL
eukprot:2177841-Pyramimonas_sp.AAC.1